jgi:hypothetical protein
VPKPYDADHPHAELLKRKSFAIHAPLPEDWQSRACCPASARSSRHAADLAHPRPDVSGLTQPIRPMDQDDRHDQVLLILQMPPDQALKSIRPS